MFPSPHLCDDLNQTCIGLRYPNCTRSPFGLALRERFADMFAGAVEKLDLRSIRCSRYPDAPEWPGAA